MHPEPKYVNSTSQISFVSPESYTQYIDFKSNVAQLRMTSFYSYAYIVLIIAVSRLM